MAEKFGKEYFYGYKQSNYFNYERLDPSKQFKSIISFVKTKKLTGRFLDVGCAFGLLLKELSSYFTEIYGCDISAFAIKKAKQKIPNANLKILDLDSVDDLPYPNEFFDFITCLDVLEHTKNFEYNFKKIITKLKCGGFLVISVPIDSRLRKIFSFLDKDKTHISILKEKEILQIVKKNKLQIISKRYFCPMLIFYKIYKIPIEIELILKKL